MYRILQTELPPTLYSLMQSIVNYNVDEKTKIKDLAREARSTIFNFNYPLSKNVSRETFEEQILIHYISRRINYDTLTMFQLMLNSKLNEIMPKYNMMFDSLEGWSIYRGYSENRILTDNTTSALNGTLDKKINTRSANATNNESSNVTNSENIASGHNTNDNRYSDLPQQQIDDVQSGKYMTQYTLNSDDTSTTSEGSATSNILSKTDGSASSSTSENNTNSNNSTSDKKVSETIERTVDNQLDVLINFQTKYNNIYTLLYSELDELFYGLV